MLLVLFGFLTVTSSAAGETSVLLMTYALLWAKLVCGKLEANVSQGTLAALPCAGWAAKKLVGPTALSAVWTRRPDALSALEL